ncbi:Autophagy protein 7 [Entophlyctis luteolus]|nr:Autophagy protein 7 [Entophlyctis luteolus]
MSQSPTSQQPLLLQFAPFASAVDATFWQRLSQLKMDEFRLDTTPQKIIGHYSPSNSLMRLSEGGFDIETAGYESMSFTARGLIENTNTIEEFKAKDKPAMLRAAAEEVWTAIKSGEAVKNHAFFSYFSVLAFADIKKYKFYYWFAFPALLPAENYTTPAKTGIRLLKDIWNPKKIESLRLNYCTLRAVDSGRSAPIDTAFALAKRDVEDPNLVHVGKLSEWDSFWKDVPTQDWTIVFADPSTFPTNPGWPLRNFLLMLKYRYLLNFINVICYREGASNKADVSGSLYVSINMPGPLSNELPKSVGWEKNSSGKLGARLVDLAPMMDPARLAETAVDLNLKLMRWRIMPDLKLQNISLTRCLLLGSGTLGCYVARGLMAWGVRKITFVDNGNVSYSNPVRQPLFNFEDSIAGKPKAEAAADTMKKIFPGIMTEGVNMTIPMPGHASPSLDATRRDVNQLHSLVEQHDAIFLLTDSREARWLPTVLGAACDKIVINCALGFDTFLVMRHGVRSADVPSGVDPEAFHGGKMGCYYCNDVVAPADSLTDRSLDQQCTVTRPGLAMTSSGLAVEMLISLLNHPNRSWAPAEVVSNVTDRTAYPLGIVPHQIRGYLTHFSNLLVTGHAYDKCTACSPTILNEYRLSGAEFVHKALANPKYLEELTGLTKLHDATESADVEWEEEDE